MKTNAWVVTVAGVIACSALQAQNIVYQQAGAISADGNITVSSGGPVGFATTVKLGGNTITGSPFSATEQRHSLQMLANGARIEQTNTVMLSRDSEGRTRRESIAQNSNTPASVTIEDPVAGANYFLDPASKTANKLPMPKLLSARVPAGAGAGSNAVYATSIAPSPAMAGAMAVADSAKMEAAITMGIVSSNTAATPVTEDLGTQNVNGVLAKGTRSTITIPVGQIGNDQALQVVNERWYSDELGMLVKSSNSDPRFGTTTYELTDISRAAPDPSLFQIPPDYTLNEGKPMFRVPVAK